MQETEPYLHKLARYGTFNTHDALKILALILMGFDHTGWVLYPDDHLWLRAVGRACAPIFFFLIGYARSYRNRADIIFCAVLLALVNTPLAGSLLNINILVSFILARLLLAQLENGRIPMKRPWDWWALLFILFPTTALFHYGTPGLMFAYCGWLQKHAGRFKRHDRAGILIASTGFYGAMEATMFGFDTPETLLCFAALGVMGVLLWRYRPRPMALPAPLARHAGLLAWPARYSLWLYTLHLVAIQLITGIHY